MQLFWGRFLATLSALLASTRAQYVKKTTLLPFVYTDAIKSLDGDRIAIKMTVLNDVYPAVQYKIECGLYKNQNEPIIPDWIIAEKLAYSKCHDFVNVQKNAVTLVFNGVSYVRRLSPVPAFQRLDNENGNSGTLNDDRPGISLGKISECCDPATCPSNCIETPRRDCTIELYGPGLQRVQIGPGTMLITTLDFIARIPCEQCSLKSCLTNCSNGQYATNYTDYSQDGDTLQTKKIECVACPPGTWNTCLQDATSCQWRIPTGIYDRNLNDAAVGISIAGILGGPVGSCFPCMKVSEYPYHFVNTAKQVKIDLDLPWICPGGTLPPRNCLTRNFVQSKNGSTCVCKPGSYPLNDTDCVPCPKGYKCPDGLLEKCPRHYYQPEEGKSECLPCAEPAENNGFYSLCLQQGLLLKVCDPDVPGTQNQRLSEQCIPCNQCRRPFVSTTLDDPNRFFCYRDR